MNYDVEERYDYEARRENEWVYYQRKYPDVSWNYHPDKSGLLVVCEPIIEESSCWIPDKACQFKKILTFNRKYIDIFSKYDELKNTKFVSMCGVPCFNQYWALSDHIGYDDRINGIVCLNKGKANTPDQPSEIYGLRVRAMVDLVGSGLTRHVWSRERWGGEMYQGEIPFVHSHEENLKILNRYKFCICFESLYHELWSWDFITERIFNCFKAKVIPIYYGCYNIEQWVPKHLFIDYRDYINGGLSELLASFPKKRFIEMTEEAFAWNKTHRIGNVMDMEELILKHRR